MSDVLQIGLVCLRILTVISNVLTFLIALGSQAFYKALISSIQSSMLNQLDNTYINLFSLFRSFLFVATTAQNAQSQG